MTEREQVYLILTILKIPFWQKGNQIIINTSKNQPMIQYNFHDNGILTDILTAGRGRLHLTKKIADANILGFRAPAVTPEVAPNEDEECDIDVIEPPTPCSSSLAPPLNLITYKDLGGLVALRRMRTEVTGTFIGLGTRSDVRKTLDAFTTYGWSRGRASRTQNHLLIADMAKINAYQRHGASAIGTGKIQIAAANRMPILPIKEFWVGLNACYNFHCIKHITGLFSRIEGTRIHSVGAVPMYNLPVTITLTDPMAERMISKPL